MGYLASRLSTPVAVGKCEGQSLIATQANIEMAFAVETPTEPIFTIQPTLYQERREDSFGSHTLRFIRAASRTPSWPASSVSMV